MNLKTIPYNQYELELPQEGKYILAYLLAKQAQKQNDSIIVYQAYNNQIAAYAIANQKFGGSSFSLTRMTWIKPNFLWMMYRAGWASKVNQERILAIEISIDGFYKLLEEGVPTSYKSNLFSTETDWRTALNNSEVRIQWDPDHNPHGEKLVRKAIQIGMKGKAFEAFNQDYILSIADISTFVKTQSAFLKTNFEKLEVVKESVIEIPDYLKQKLGMD